MSKPTINIRRDQPIEVKRPRRQIVVELNGEDLSPTVIEEHLEVDLTKIEKGFLRKKSIVYEKTVAWI